MAILPMPGVDRGATYQTTAQPAQTRFIPWTSAMPQGLAPTAAPAANTQALGAPASPRFIPVPRTQAAPGQQQPQAQGPDPARFVGLGLGGLNTGLTGLQLANQAGGLGLNLGNYQQALGGLTGAYGLAQGIRMDDPLRAIGGGPPTPQNPPPPPPRPPLPPPPPRPPPPPPPSAPIRHLRPRLRGGLSRSLLPSPRARPSVRSEPGRRRSAQWLCASCRSRRWSQLWHLPVPPA